MDRRHHDVYLCRVEECYLNPSLTIWSHTDFTYTRVQEFNNVLSDETHCLSNIEKDNKGIILLFCIIKLYYYIENGEEKDVQSLMNNACMCGYYCVAFLHYINAWQHRTKDLYADVDIFLHYFDDLNKSIDWKKNEYILKMFFQSSDPALRKEIDVIGHPDHIT